MASSRPHGLIIGCGDIGTRLGLLLVDQGWQVTGLRRHAEVLPATFERVSTDIFQLDADMIAALPTIDVVVYSVTPTERSEAGYQRAYVDGVRRIMQSIVDQVPRLWLHFSSSRVWSEDDGSWVNESTPAKAADASAQHLIDGEQMVVQSGIPHVITRFSGLYGKDAGAMQRMFARWTQYEPTSRAWANRIHADDAAGFCAHVLSRWYAGEAIESLYAVSDDRPTMRGELANWQQSAADEFSIETALFPEAVDTGKRIDNQRLHHSGYQLIYPAVWTAYQNYYREIHE